jgi:hypothetical protein
MPIVSSRLLKPTIALFAAAFALWCAGCAKIAEPLPPEIRIPKPATDLIAQQASDFVLLSVPMPSLNTNGSPVNVVQKTDGSPAGSLRRVDVFRLAASKSVVSNEPVSDAEFLKQALRIQSIPSASFAIYLHDGRFLIQDRIQTASGSSIRSDEFQYAVLFINKKNQAAGLSNRARIVPPPPEGLSAILTEQSIRLTWKAPPQNMDESKPARIAGYAVYRSETRDQFPATPMNSDPLDKTEYEDRSFEFGKTYYYSVRLIGSVRNPRAESFPSETIEVRALDTFPPSPPRDFHALPEGGTVFLLWAPSLSKDVVGYRMYRREKGSDTRQLLQTELITSWSFRDKNVAPGKSYEYSLRAVDLYKNESEAVEAAAEVP